jgi:hypothetical protein
MVIGRADRRATWRGRRSPVDPSGHRTTMFFLFSSRLGCLGSLLVSAIITVVLLLIFDVL